MRTLPAAITAEINADIQYIVYLIDMELDTPVYLTNADINIFYEGKTYQSWGLDLGSMESSLTPTLDKLSITIDNTDYNTGPSSWCMTSEVRGKRFLLRLAFLNSSSGVIGTITKFDGIIDSVPSITDQARFDIYSHMINWQRKILRRHSASCAHVFKDNAAQIVIGGYYYTCIRNHVSNANNQPETGTWATYWSKGAVYAGETIDKELTTEAGSTVTTEAGAKIIASVPPESWETDNYYSAGTCNYTGSVTSCDRSVARCQALGNYENFGGFKYLPSLADKQIWWGKVPR